MGLTAHAEVSLEERKLGATTPAIVMVRADLEAVRPTPRDDYMPETRWDFHDQGEIWTRSTMAALQGHGKALIDSEPHDIRTWCPAYPNKGPTERAAFWTGFLSALAKHESTWRPRVVGGGGKWYGLTQILPATARGYDCKARTGAALKDGAANLSCAVRIMAVTVTRDNAVARKSNGRLGGVAADWGPMVNAKKRREMAAWTRAQDYCGLTRSPRPTFRPIFLVENKLGLDVPEGADAAQVVSRDTVSDTLID